MRLLDRYILKSFLLPFLYCLIGIVAIWLILDMGDKIPSLVEAHASPKEILRFYRIQLPQITVFCLPIAMLLALLYSFSRLSRSNEIVSMITAGVSIFRLMVPLIGLGLVFSLLSLALNYQMAPESEIRRKVMFDELTQGKKKSADLNGVLFRNRSGNRTWYFERLGISGNESRGVQVLQQDDKGDPVWKVYAKGAKFLTETKTWVFSEGEILKLQGDGKIAWQKSFEKRSFEAFDETPWRISSADLRAEDLSVPSLRNYLWQNRDFPTAQLAPFQTHLFYRWSLPWLCLVVMITGGALGIVFSRRGVLGSVANALVLFFAMLFVNNLFLSLGQGARIPAPVAAWTPVLLFGVIGLILLTLRSAGRSLNPFRG